MIDTETYTPALGDAVALNDALPSRGLKQGQRGIIVGAGSHLPWGMVSVRFHGRYGAGEGLFLVHPRHLTPCKVSDRVGDVDGD